MLIVLVLFCGAFIRIFSGLVSSFAGDQVQIMSKEANTSHSQSQPGDSNPPVPVPCDTEQCERNLTESLRRSMDLTADPCDDFYQFACGNWKSALGGTSQLALVRERTLSKLLDLTEQINEADTEALRKLKVIYDSCVHFDHEKEDENRKQSLREGSLWELENLRELQALEWDLAMTFDITAPATSSRREACIEHLEKLMPFAMAHKYILQYVKRETVDEATEMYNNVMTSSQNLVSSLEWMDHTTKEGVMEKMQDIKVHIGYPNWLRNPLALDDCYRGLDFMNRGDNATFKEHLRTLLKWEWEAKKYHNRECLLIPAWNMYGRNSQVGISAYYQPQSNSVVIPAGKMQQPLFDNGLRAADYGALGMSMGHELLHGFLFTDIKAFAEWPSSNPLGAAANKRNSWNPTAKAEFMRKSKCFQNQDNNYWSTDLGGVLRSDISQKTSLTLDEDIADTVGLRLSSQAYRRYVNHLGKPEPRIPGLEQYTPEQVFFLSFANGWCTTERPSLWEMRSKHRHSPSKYRVIGALSNSPEFSEAWKCPESSKMNPKTKCTL